MFKPGLETFFETFNTNKAVRVGLTVNNTSRDANGIHLVNRIKNDKRFILKRIFTPEHGFASDAPDGEAVSNSLEQSTKTEIISLYGNNRTPSHEQLSDIDLLIYDIQDVGVRFYTYISTLRNVMEAANNSNIDFAVLDRPDLIGGVEVEGPMLYENLYSFVGHLPIPLRYGLTPGELSLWWKDKAKLKLNLKVYKCFDYKCPTPFEKLNFPWYKPSPSMVNIETAKFYPGTCLFEGTNVSEGRGTEAPFQKIGAPWVDSNKWLEMLHYMLPKDINASKTEFIPTFSKYKDEKCYGIELSTANSFLKDSVYVGIITLYTLIKTHPNKVKFENRPTLKYPFIDYLSGIKDIRQCLESGLLPQKELFYSQEIIEFKQSRKKYFLYNRQ